MRLKRSGYNEAYRYSIMKAGIDIFKKKREEEASGGRPVYRSRIYERKSRDQEKRMKKKTWFKQEKKSIHAPLIIEPCSKELKEDIERVCQGVSEGFGINVKVQERGGTKLSCMAGANPTSNGGGCGRSDCLLCIGTTEEGKGRPSRCMQASVSYFFTCMGCKEEGIKACYPGETGSNGYNRWKSHLSDLSHLMTKMPWQSIALFSMEGCFRSSPCSLMGSKSPFWRDSPQSRF